MRLILMTYFYVRVDRTRKVPITVLIRALGIGTNAEIIELFGEEPKILQVFEQRHFCRAIRRVCLRLYIRRSDRVSLWQ